MSRTCKIRSFLVSHRLLPSSDVIGYHLLYVNTITPTASQCFASFVSLPFSPAFLPHCCFHAQFLIQSSVTEPDSLAPRAHLSIALCVCVCVLDLEGIIVTLGRV